jgi:hypothetical protein
MERELFAVTSYCTLHNIDHSFIASLRDEGLITIIIENEGEYLEENELPELETYTRWHHDLGINAEGIDAIRHLVSKLRQVQFELNSLRDRLKLYEDDVF